MVSTQVLQQAIIQEIVSYLGLPSTGWRGALLALLGRLPAARIASLAARFDQQVEQSGFSAASRWLLPQVMHAYRVSGTELIPASGPLILASNHPGTFDCFLIAACLPRQDVKVIARDTPVLRRMQATSRHTIFSRRDIYHKMTAARGAIEHLQAGGALILFPTGKLDPDPHCMPGADTALQNWSRSLELFLRKAPHTLLQVVVVGGLIKAQSLLHPLACYYQDAYRKQIAAEILQLSQQLILQKKHSLVPEITFGETYTVNRLLSNGNGDLMQGVVEAARKLLFFHQCAN